MCDEKTEDELFALGGKDDADVDMQAESVAINDNGKCPTCDPKIRQIGMELPHSLHTLTHLSCSLTGEAMTDSNPPIYLPSGYLICERAKLSLIAE